MLYKILEIDGVDCWCRGVFGICWWCGLVGYGNFGWGVVY
jgi:hypothetical protein